MEPVLLFGSLIFSALISLFLGNPKTIVLINIFTSFFNLVLTIVLSLSVLSKDTVFYFNEILFLDAYSSVQLLIISSITLITSIYSYKYTLKELKTGTITIKKFRLFYVLFNLFVLSMYLIAFSNNIMLMWISLEATTLATAFLIGFNGDKLSLEAAWKYIILCSLGITIGLIGIIILIYSSGKGVFENSLNWTYLSKYYSTFDVRLTIIAFTFIFVGIGTKAGLAPMHTWLSDGHSEAPSPISSMMSGVLLNLALYTVIRFYVIVKIVNNLSNLSKLFIVFGTLSLVISSFSILKQNNYKRLLAFSSVENMGIISLGIGFGGYFGVFAAVLHSIIHAFGKTLLFLTAGNILENYKTKRIDRVHNMINTMPLNSLFLFVGMLIITGVPPFASFFSEYYVLISGIQSGYLLIVALYTFSILIVFAGFLNAFIRMIFTKNLEENMENLENKIDEENLLPLFIALIFAIFVSFFSSGFVNNLIEKSIGIINL